MTFKFSKLKIPEIIIIKPQLFPDERGIFFEGFKESEFILNGINKKFIQDNFSHSIHGVIRGLHYQNNPKAQAKLVTVLKGKIFDVAVDIRKNSPSFGKWVGKIISEEDYTSIYIPEGFAHGFCVLSEFADVLYKVNSEYSPKYEKGLIWNDPTINISWPTKNPIISNKDKKLSTLENLDSNFIYKK